MEVIYKTFNGVYHTADILSNNVKELASRDQVHMLGGVSKVTPVANTATRLFDLLVELNTGTKFTIQEVTVFTVSGEYGEMQEICDLYSNNKIGRGVAARAIDTFYKTDFLNFHDSTKHLSPEDQEKAFYDLEAKEALLRDEADKERKVMYAHAHAQLVQWIEDLGGEYV